MDETYVHKIFILIRGLYKLMERDMEELAQNLGLTSAEIYVLCIVLIEKEISVSEIAEIGLWDVSTVMQVIKRLKQKELVSATKKGNDRRITYITATEKGNNIKNQHTLITFHLKEYLLQKINSDIEQERQKTKVSIDFLIELNEHFYGKKYVSRILNWQ